MSENTENPTGDLVEERFEFDAPQFVDFFEVQNGQENTDSDKWFGKFCCFFRWFVWFRLRLSYDFGPLMFLCALFTDAQADMDADERQMEQGLFIFVSVMCRNVCL